MRSPSVLHEAHETAMDELKTESSITSNTSLPEFPCPNECSECCASDSWFGSRKKFKCILKNAKVLPRNHICTGLSIRASSPGQHKVECEFTEQEGQEMYQRPGKCSTKTACCCRKEQLNDLPFYVVVRQDIVCVDTSHSSLRFPQDYDRELKVTHPKSNVEEIFTLQSKWLNHFDRPKPCYVNDNRYHRQLRLLGAQCMTDLKGLERVGESFECPIDMMETDTEHNINCVCDDDC